eukprot:2759896-Prymnesium_polylepis.1
MRARQAALTPCQPEKLSQRNSSTPPCLIASDLVSPAHARYTLADMLASGKLASPTAESAEPSSMLRPVALKQPTASLQLNIAQAPASARAAGDGCGSVCGAGAQCSPRTADRTRDEAAARRVGEQPWSQTGGAI